MKFDDLLPITASIDPILKGYNLYDKQGNRIGLIKGSDIEESLYLCERIIVSVNELQGFAKIKDFIESTESMKKELIKQIAISKALSNQIKTITNATTKLCFN